MNGKDVINTIPDSVIDTITTHNLLCPEDPVLVAVSGGADSVALVHMLNRIAPVFGFKMAIAHLNHGLRGDESDEDQLFVSHLAENLDLPFHTKKSDVREYSILNKLSLEEAGRDVRYAFLFETAESQGFGKIAIAHHADDNAELFLMNLIRGSGTAGLKAMEAVGYQGRVIRPFIGTFRDTLLSYIESNNLSYRTDSSNTDQSFLRNRVRLDLIPYLEKNYQNGLNRIIARTAAVIQRDESFIEQVIEPMFRQVISDSDEQKNMLTLSVSAVSQLHPAAQRRVIRKAMLYVKKNMRRISFLHTELTADLLKSDKKFASLDFPDRLRVIRNGDSLIFRIENGPLRQTPVTDRS